MKRIATFLCLLSLLSACALFKSSPKTGKTKLLDRPIGAYSGHVRSVIAAARVYTGTPYKSGGNDQNGIDCSGLICSTFADIGVKIPRISWQQAEFGTEVVKIEDIRAGDWVFFVPLKGESGYISHSGIVTDVRGKRDIRFIHASSSKGVREDNLFSDYFRNRFAKAMRPF